MAHRGVVYTHRRRLIKVVEHARIQQDHDFVHDSKRLSDQVEVVVEFRQDLCDLLLPVNLYFEVVACVFRICGYDQELLVGFIVGDGDLELLMGPGVILFVLSDRNLH